MFIQQLSFLFHPNPWKNWMHERILKVWFLDFILEHEVMEINKIFKKIRIFYFFGSYIKL